MTAKRLALNLDGEITYCSADDEHVGKGRCDHLDHIKHNETSDEFLKRCNLKYNTLKHGIVLSDKTSVKIPVLYYNQNGTLHLNKINDFGNKMQRGVQSKGLIALADKDFLNKQFLKLDRFNGDLHAIDDKTDVINSSFSESLSLILADSLFNKDNFQSPHGVAVKIETTENSEPIELLGLLSENYQKEGITEYVLASDENSKNNSIITTKEYDENIIQEFDNDKALNSMIRYYNKVGVDKEEAKNFILRQNALDIVLGNNDRLLNGGNSMILTDSIKEKTYPFNPDLGRLLQIDWRNTMEESYKRGHYPNGQEVTQEDKDDLTQDNVNDILNNQKNGIFKGSLQKKVQFLLDNGLKPIAYDKNEMIKDLDSHINYLNHVDPNFQYYLEEKKRVLLKILENDEIKKIMKEV